MIVQKLLFLATFLFMFVQEAQGEVMANRTNSLTRYRKRRDFAHTTEPYGDRSKTKSKHPLFVIQKHKARSMHYDVRFEINRVLKSWAVPKGPSTDPRDKRLAIATDDHPLSYATFEGVIPEENYGAGAVMVWDTGTFKNIKTKHGKKVALNSCLRNGQLELWLEGTKLWGGYTLIRMGQGTDAHWLMIKMNDEYAHKKIKNGTKSALTGRTIKQIEADHE